MDREKLENIHDKLSKDLELYIHAVVEKYGGSMQKYQLEKLANITDYRNILKIYDYGSVNGYANNRNISMPLCADKIMNLARFVPGYGINKGHKAYNEETLIINDNTFVDYIKHVFISGTDIEGYYSDMLLHEVMHFCGSGGATALREGINELLTRKLALDKGFRTSGCGYPKEVQIAYQLQEIFGEDTINKIAFMHTEEEVYSFLENTKGTKAANLYKDVSVMMEEEFDNKYYRYMDSYGGITGILKKVRNYAKIDYSNIYSRINEYQREIQNQTAIKK